MKIVIISDTHELHHDLRLPEGDLLIHAGDFCDNGNIDGVYDFLGWMEETDFKHKILIAGNHDFYVEDHPEKFKALLPAGIIYLEDSGVELEGIHFWGSPVQPDLTGWAFGRNRGEEMKAHWDLIPKNTDILITHSPPYGILDSTGSGYSVGCEVLTEQVFAIAPKLHVFGHVHASYGQEYDNGTLFINASNISSDAQRLVNPPIELDWSVVKGF